MNDYPDEMELEADAHGLPEFWHQPELEEEYLRREAAKAAALFTRDHPASAGALERILLSLVGIHTYI